MIIRNDGWFNEPIYDYAMSFVGTPYRWGGDDFHSLDCSGFVQILLAAGGEDPPGDQTAQGLYDWFSERARARFDCWGFGALAFYGKTAGSIYHVAFCLNQYQMIEASGGDSGTNTVDDAKRDNAFVKIVTIRKDNLIAMLKPQYSKVGAL